MKIAYSDRYVKRVGRITSRCFEQAAKEVLNLKHTDRYSLNEIVTELRMVKSFNQQVGHPQDKYSITVDDARLVDDKYLENILKLPSKDLNQIINCHKTQQIRRMPRTIEAILNELANRELLNDSNQSDLNDMHGDMDETATHS